MDVANKRIAKNTMYMYVRLVTTLVVGLYISRLSLEILGVSDYGLFAVVGSVLGIFTFISSSLASATSRFFNIEMGKADGDVNACFNINLVLHVGLAILVLILAETIGLWYVYHHLNIAEGKLGDAVFAYQLCMLTACVGIINTPYQSLLAAHEQFRFMAILDIVNSLVRLGCILLLTFVSSNELRWYSVIFSITTLTTFVVYHWMAYAKWRNIIKFRWVKGWNSYRNVLVFNNWNMLATMSYMANFSGADLLLNAFFGTAVNGAFAVSKTVKQGLMNLTGNIDNVSAPQIIQSYAAHDNERYTFLCNKIGRINILVFELICFPLLIELDFLLHIWLGKVPAGAWELTCLSIIQGGIALTCGGIFNLINASGRIKWFKVNVSFFFLICIPIGYVWFKMGGAPYTLLILFIIADVLQRAVQLLLLHTLLHFDSWKYTKEAYGRPSLIALIASVGLWLHAQLYLETSLQRILSIVICALSMVALVYFIGLTSSEQQQALAFIKRRR